MPELRKDVDRQVAVDRPVLGRKRRGMSLLDKASWKLYAAIILLSSSWVFDTSNSLADFFIGIALAASGFFCIRSAVDDIWKESHAGQDKR